MSLLCLSLSSIRGFQRSRLNILFLHAAGGGILPYFLSRLCPSSVAHLVFLYLRELPSRIKSSDFQRFEESSQANRQFCAIVTPGRRPARDQLRPGIGGEDGCPRAQEKIKTQQPVFFVEATGWRVRDTLW